MSQNVFLKELDFYKRDLDPVNQYLEQSSFYLSKISGNSIEECRSKVLEKMKVGRNPTVKYFERADNGDKQPVDIALTEYLSDIIHNNEVLVPTFTSYLNTKEKSSILVEFTDNNKKQRGVSKKEAFIAKVKQLWDLFIIKNNEQTNMKLRNNSMSGAFATKGSVLNNPTGHNTLTSITRCVTSVSNASNEKIIEGNRHYYNVDITLNNLISLLVDLDSHKMQTVMDKYSLVYPTVNDVLECITRSTDLYWLQSIDSESFKIIIDFVNTFTPVERAAVIYIGDLYHIRKHNDSFIRSFLQILSTRVTGNVIEDAANKMHKVDEMVSNFAHQIFIDEMKGKGKEYDKLDPEVLQSLLHTCYHIESVINDYKDFIDCFFLTKNVPASTAYIPTMMRRTVTVSDTDSTMFSVDHWVEWYFGHLKFDNEAFALAGSVMFIATQCMAHNLAMFSANMNVSRDKLFDLQMKPEFVFPVLAQTPVAKHYFTFFIAQEGNVFEKPEMEIKGVYLKDSSVPKAIMKDSHRKMEEILMTVYQGNKISLKQLVIDLYHKELDIIEHLKNGNSEYYKKSKIKQAASYVNDADRSPFGHHLFWNEVFAAKYGEVEEPPYLVIKLPTLINNITAVKKLIDIIEDRPLAERLAAWFARRKKTELNTIYLSETYVRGFGIPEELKNVINYKAITLQITGSDRMVIDTLGFCIKSDKLISEMYQF